MNLNTEDYSKLTQWILKQADRFAHGRVVSLLEGGYNLEILGPSVATHIEALVNHPS